MKKPTEHSIQEKLQSLEYAHHESAWLGLKEHMTQPTPPVQQKRRRPWFFWLITGLVIATTAWAYWPMPPALGYFPIDFVASAVAVPPMPSNNPTTPPELPETTAQTANAPRNTKRISKSTKTTVKERKNTEAVKQQVKEAVVSLRPATEEGGIEVITAPALINELSLLPTLQPSPISSINQLIDSLPAIAIARKEYRQSLALELGGGSGWGGIWYERRMGKHLRIGTGLGLYAENQLHLALPVGLAIEKPLGSQATSWFWGGGTTFTYFYPISSRGEQLDQPFWTIFPHLTLVRYSQAGFVLKIKGGVLIESEQGESTPWAGISIGRAF